jgi:predicted membrane-bound spermidine synthase
LELIKKSAEQLKFFADGFEDCIIVLPRPGCNSGGRNWEAEIYPILEKYLDERFLVVYK